jgi:short-subunit dehydrogenase
MSVNLDGVVNGINAFVPLFLEQNEGYVVNTASEAGLVGVAGMGPYTASKFAVVGVSESLFNELANTGKNVHVSVLCPRFVRTRINESGRNMPKELEGYGERPENLEMGKVLSAMVEGGIDAKDVAAAVEDAVANEKFWILTHEHSAIRITELRLDWMRGGPSPASSRLREKP